MKQGFLCIAAFVFIAFCASAVYGGADWPEALKVSFLLASISLAALWLYGVFCIFERRYVVASEGIFVFHRNELVRHIPWSEVHRVSRGHLQVRSRSGQSISFNLPPPIQAQARKAIQAFHPDGQAESTKLLEILTMALAAGAGSWTYDSFFAPQPRGLYRSLCLLGCMLLWILGAQAVLAIINRTRK